MSTQNENIKINEIKSEENNIKINIKSDENNFIQNENKFIPPKQKIIWKSNIQFTYHFKLDIERIWLIIRDFDLLSLINNKGHYPIVCLKGKNTWKEANEFKGNLFSYIPFIARVEKCENFPEIKIIKWLFNINYKKYFKIKFELLKVTEDNTCVVSSKTKFDDVEFMKMMEKKFNPKEEKNYFNKIEEILQSQPINLFQYESVIINSKMEEIWDIITDFNKLTVIAPNNNCLPNINIVNMKIGETIKANGIYDDEIEATLEYKEDRPGWNKWLIALTISKLNEKKNSILLQLTKINEEECQLTFISKFHYSIDSNIFKDISKRKKYVLISLKDYFDNFYSPNN